ncbi:hypothetical protein BU14_0053s0041 [Porphyra umbilicalis]|uniref:Galactosyltransferase C-terminal domain-containing protein n=1 Tax=Porphyra umbilicalis TaxID=2786 RepID=A0A1X6PI63_PORUM|nr:hypothetical protein BU14_0053s0041 [Porphyra umbilicalis]|eukprot:OSX80378.1 hypothetical protein BU14_0053s0041 [Porphyra umbilicalis]
MGADAPAAPLAWAPPSAPSTDLSPVSRAAGGGAGVPPPASRQRRAGRIVLVDWSTDAAAHVPVQAVVEGAEAAAAAAAGWWHWWNPWRAVRSRAAAAAAAAGAGVGAGAAGAPAPATPSAPRMVSVTVGGEDAWSLTRAINVGASLASGRWLLKVDCDTALAPDFLGAHPRGRGGGRGGLAALTRPHGGVAAAVRSAAAEVDEADGDGAASLPWYYAADVAAARDDNEAALVGVVLLPRARFDAVGGYDERLATYGGEATDLYARLEAPLPTPDAEGGAEAAAAAAAAVASGGATPLRRRPLRLDTLRHVPHGPATGSDALGRLPHTAWAPAVSAHLNTLALAHLPPWSTAAASHRSRYRFRALSRSATYLAATATLTTPAAPSLLRAAVATEVTALAEEAALHDDARLPWAVLTQAGVSPHVLLRQLSGFARAHPGWSLLPRRGDAAGGKAGRGESAGGPAGVIIAQLDGSPAERLLGLASALALARSHGRPLFVALRRERSPQGVPLRDGATPLLSALFDLHDGGGGGGGGRPPLHWPPTAAAAGATAAAATPGMTAEVALALLQPGGGAAAATAAAAAAAAAAGAAADAGTVAAAAAAAGGSSPPPPRRSATTCSSA